MATPPTPTSGALTVNSTTGVILSPVTAALFRSANGIGTGTGDVTASGTLTANALILGGGTTVVSASALTYSGTTLSVPASFGITGAGSLAFTAGGTNQNVTITPSGTGYIFSQGDIRIEKTSVDAELRLNASAGQTRRVGFATGGSLRWIFYTDSASEAGSNSGSDFHIGRYNDGGSIIDTPVNIKRSSGNVMIRTTTDGGGVLQIAPASNVSASAWGVGGAMLRVGALTFTDSSSSGTVATAVANSFAVPTFAASSATTFTNAANLYIAGDVANGTNVTLTNSYGLWNVGKTRLDGVTRITDVTASTTSSNGALVVSGGAGFGGNINSSGVITASSTGLTGNFQAAFQTLPTFSVTASSFNAGFYSGSTTANTAVTYPLVAGMLIDDITKGAASTVTVQTGLVIRNQTKGVTNYAIQTGTGLVQLNTAIIDGSAATTFTGGAGNMTITAGTGASRTLALQTTTSGSAATTALTLGADQSATFANNITMGGTAILTKPGGTIPLITTNTAITDGAGAKAGTLLNAPAAGNPTKWIRINDNGTTRYIPAW
jgi:hypothetical protein